MQISNNVQVVSPCYRFYYSMNIKQYSLMFKYQRSTYQICEAAWGINKNNMV